MPFANQHVILKTSFLLLYRVFWVINGIRGEVMNARPITWRVAAVSMIVVAVCFCSAADAQRNKSKYKTGDRVEVKDGFDWKPATVVSVDSFSGWVEARPDLPPGTAQFRGPGKGRKFPPSSVRAGSAVLGDTTAQSTPDRPMRKWSDKTGKFSIDARYQETNGDKVALVKADGNRIEVPIAKLSDEDNRYLKELNDAAESPFQEVGGASSAAAPGASPSPSAQVNAKKANWNGAKLVQPQTFKNWSFTPPAPKGQVLPSSSIGDANVTLTDIPDSQKFFEDIEGIYASSDGNRVVVCRNKGEVSQDKELYLEIVNVGKRQAGGLIQLPDTTLALDVNADATLIMLRPAVFGSGENGMLTIARFDAGRVTPVQQWEPYSEEDFAPSRDIDKAWFLSENRVMTINGHGRALTIWDVESCKALINIPVGVSFALQLSLSPDRQLLAVIMSEGIAIIDVAAGRHVATVPTQGRRYTKVAIRNDNTKLAGLSDEGVTVWNLSDGKVMSEFYTTSLGWHTGLQWTGDYLLADSKYLFDVERRILLWEYQDPPGTGVTAELQNGRLYAVAKPSSDKGNITLVSAAIPNEAAIEQAKSLPPAEALLVVKPGDPVSIEVDIDPSVNLADEIQKAQDAKAKKANGQDKDEKIVYLNPNGAKRRHSANSYQRFGNRWLESC